MSVFIDSGAFVAALFRTDRHHAAFRALFLQKHKVKRVWGTDGDLTFTGAALLP